MIDVIVPTMWVPKNFIGWLEKYVNYKNISRIIIIDNNKKFRPKSDVFLNSKIEVVCYGRNIYVNPAWNEGMIRSTSNVICLLSDDVFVDESVFEMVKDFDAKPGDIIGVNLRGSVDNYKIDDYIDTLEEIRKINYDLSKPIGSQLWGFGICIFIHRKTYKHIPSLYQIWYGDDFLAQNAKNVYAIYSNKIKGEISETLKTFKKKSDAEKRILLDSKNFLRFNHFKNGKNWSIPNEYVRNSTS